MTSKANKSFQRTVKNLCFLLSAEFAHDISKTVQAISP